MVIVYSKKIIGFIQEIQEKIRAVLSIEMGIKVRGGRFYNPEQTISYPIKVVIYNNKKMLGYFDPNFYELGFHEQLIYGSGNQLLNVIRHELAHYILFNLYGGRAEAHGVEFRRLCQSIGWGSEVYLATSCFEGGEEIAATEEGGVLRKVKKLMALSTSSNTHEAELALLKSQQLLAKHNLEESVLEAEEEGRIFLKRVFKQKKEDGKMRCIAKIIETFFVSVIYSRTREGTHLEIVGTDVNVEIAEYVAAFLKQELDLLWQRAQKGQNLKGMIAKNSFFTGVAKGYCNKVKGFERHYSEEMSKSLMVVERQLVDARELIYPRLSRVKSSGRSCSDSIACGELAGSQLRINPGVGSSHNLGNLLN